VAGSPGSTETACRVSSHSGAVIPASPSADTSALVTARPVGTPSNPGRLVSSSASSDSTPANGGPSVRVARRVATVARSTLSSSTRTVGTPSADTTVVAQSSS